MLKGDPLKMRMETTMVTKRTPFVFESKEKNLVEATANLLNELFSDKTFSIDIDLDSRWYVFEVEDEDDI